MKNLLDATDLSDAIQMAKAEAQSRRPLMTQDDLRELERKAGIPSSSPTIAAAIATGPKDATARGDSKLARMNQGYQKFELIRDWDRDEDVEEES